MSILDKPLPVIFPELNSAQIAILRELLKREYERGKVEADIVPFIYKCKHGFLGGRCETDGNCNKTVSWSISEPTPMNYTANVEKEKE